MRMNLNQMVLVLGDVAHSDSDLKRLDTLLTAYLGLIRGFSSDLVVDGVSYRVKKGAVSGQPYFYSAIGEEQLLIDKENSVIATPKGNIRSERHSDNGADRRVRVVKEYENERALYSGIIFPRDSGAKSLRYYLGKVYEAAKLITERIA